MADTRADARESLLAVLGASGVSVLLWLVPFAGLAVYPIRLFVTLVHEIGHALGALVTLGWPAQIEVYADASGLTEWTGGVRLVAQAAGYVGAPLIGGAMLLLGARRTTVRPALSAAGAALLLVTVWLCRNPLAFATGALFGGLFLGFGLWARPRVARFVLSFFSVQCMLGALYDLGTLFRTLGGDAGVQTDAYLMAQATGGLVPAVVWAVLYVLMGLCALAVTLGVYYNMTVDHILGPDSI